MGLTYLLQNNDIGGDGAWALAAALQQNSSLAILGLGVCPAVELRPMGVLTHLLQENHIGDDGAEALATALQHNDSLTRLEIAVRLFTRLQWEGTALTLL